MSIFFLTQFLQTVQGLSPLAAGDPGAAVDGHAHAAGPGGRPAGRTLGRQAPGRHRPGLPGGRPDLAGPAVTTPTTPYADLVVPFVVCGIGHDPVLRAAGLAGARVGAPSRSRAWPRGPTAPSGSWAGCSGIAVLGAVFSSHGSYASGQDYVNGMTPAVYVGAAVVAVGAISALLIPGRRRTLRAIRGRSTPEPRGDSSLIPGPTDTVARTGRPRAEWRAVPARRGPASAGSDGGFGGSPSVGGDERGPGQGGAQDVGGLGPELATGAGSGAPGPRGRPGRWSRPRSGRPRRSAGPARRRSRRPARSVSSTHRGAAVSPARGCSIDGQVGEEQVDDRLGHQLGDPSASVRALRAAVVGRSP